MKDKRILLKIGSLNQPKDRWLDALLTFSEIHVICFSNEDELVHPQIIYHKFPNEKNMNRLIYRFFVHAERIRILDGISFLLIWMLRMLNQPFIRSVKSLEYHNIHSSYNDFDESAFLTILFGFRNNFTRAQKETRLYYSFLERQCFLRAGLIVLNSRANQMFYKRKYGDIFKGKQILYGLDEDVRKKGLSLSICHAQKYSETDGRIHAVILAGRVLSSPDDARSGGRLYYIPLIKKLLDAKIAVHLHTKEIIASHGKNPYAELSKSNPDFMIEQSLDFVNCPMEAYHALSRYDIGILHAHIPEGGEVTKFDRVNIPHRYYEYELAHVVPVELCGKNILIEKKASRGHAVTCYSFRELSLEQLKKVRWEIPDFDSYIKRIYSINAAFEK